MLHNFTIVIFFLYFSYFGDLAIFFLWFFGKFCSLVLKHSF